VITRTLTRALADSRKSLLLLGPRQTGKSTLIGALKPDLTIQLAHEATYLEFLRNPRELEERLSAERHAKTICIDEVQRLPSLLNTLQVLLDRPGNKQRFLLTGSSARKLRRGHANLLPGRLHTYHLGPLTFGEIADPSLSLRRALSIGTLPGIWTEADLPTAQKTLRSYAVTYLKEEVQAESLTRNLEGFTRLLQVAADQSGRFLDLSKLAGAAQIPRQSAVRFFEILEDSLLVYRIEAFAQTGARRLIQHPKFVFFDPGVLNGLLGNFEASGDRIGNLFEQWITTQIIHESYARDMDLKISTYRTEHGAEVDLIIQRGSHLYAVEIKSAAQVGTDALRGLRSFAEYYRKPHRAMVLTTGHTRKNMGDVEIWPWQAGLNELFA